jgi:hypothetical protein
MFVLTNTKYLLLKKLCWLTEMLQSTTEKIFKQKSMHLLIRSLFILPYRYCPLVLSDILYICNKNLAIQNTQRYWHWHRQSHALFYYRKISSYWLWLRTLNSNKANYYVFWFLQQEFITFIILNYFVLPNFYYKYTKYHLKQVDNTGMAIWTDCESKGANQNT